MRISYCPYRLLFKRPFGTAHGLRDGTDSVFFAIKEDGHTGYGEVTLPPYVKETVPEVIERMRALAARRGERADTLLRAVDGLKELDQAPACRAGAAMALIDLVGKQRGTTARTLLGIQRNRTPITLTTIGISPTEEVAERLADLPASGALKVKVGDPEAMTRLNVILTRYTGLLFLDANEGLEDLKDAVALAGMVGNERLLGFEQPFAPGRDHLARELSGQCGAVVYADEAVQTCADLAAQAVNYGGVNVKLMKCGGLDRAKRIADEARRHGLRLMLGSMSESSLGCTAMAQLAGEADLVDLDGPWLIKNDPFAGLRMDQGALVVPDGPGLGAVLNLPLEFIPFGA